MNGLAIYSAYHFVLGLAGSYVLEGKLGVLANHFPTVSLLPQGSLCLLKRWLQTPIVPMSAMFLGVSIPQVPDPVPFVYIVLLSLASHTGKPRASVGGDTKGTRVLETCEQSRNHSCSCLPQTTPWCILIATAK